jgi:hypothetical protein
MEHLNLNQLEQLNDDDLYLLIGKEVLINEKSFRKLTPRQIIEKARVWFTLNLPVFQEKVCSNFYIKEIYEKQEAGNLASAIVDVIAGALTGIAPATVAYLLYRQGINLLCKSYWKS